MGPEFELVKLMPAGLIPAAALLWVFLKILDKREGSMKEITTAFAAKVEQIDKVHREQVDTLVDRFAVISSEASKQQKQVIDDYIAITRDTVIAIKELQMGVRELRETVEQWDRRRDRHGPLPPGGDRRRPVEVLPLPG